MLILLPIFAFLILFLTILGVQRRDPVTDPGFRSACLKSAALLAGYVVASSETLSLFKALTQFWVAISWLLVLVAAIFYGLRSGGLRDGLKALKIKRQTVDRSSLMAVIILFIILTLLFVVAIKSPPNNNDSLRYHMARVMHWAQNNSLGHYATSYLPQLMHPIGAELFILNARLLWGNDQLANLIQYGSLLGVLLGVSAIANLLGMKISGRWLAVAFAVSLPVGILEATSTQNDYVAAFWLVSLLYYVMHTARRKSTPIETVCIGLTIGLGMLTKATFYFYAIIPIVYFCVTRLKNAGLRSVVLELAPAGGLALLLNSGFWIRNLITFGNIFGQQEFLSNHVNVIRGPGKIVAGLLQTITQNFVTPSDEVNIRIMDWVNKVSTSLDPTGWPFTIEWAWNHEDLAGNPIHFTLVILSLILLILFRKQITNRMIFVYAGILTGSFLVMTTFTRYDLYGVRYQLPFFVAWAPVFGYSIELMRRKWLASVLIVLVLLSAFPWVLFNRTRPLIAMRENPDPFAIPCIGSCTPPSVLANPPRFIIFGNLADYRDGYIAATDAVKASTCRDVGLIVDSHDPEYIFWWLLDAPQSGIRLESVWTFPELQRYTDPAFKPCMILCTYCSEETLHGLGLSGDYGNVRLYAGEHFTVEP
jgi:hypothetical protein